MLGLKVSAYADGTTSVTGAVASEESLCINGSTRKPTPLYTQRELHFRALLAQDASKLELLQG
jgi:hypothetical protein